jgi:hypothetical protein
MVQCSFRPPNADYLGFKATREGIEDMRRFRHEADLEAFQINFNGCHNLDQLLSSMTLFMQEVKPLVER